MGLISSVEPVNQTNTQISDHLFIVNYTDYSLLPPNYLKMTSNLSLHKAVFEEDFERVEQIVKTLKAEEINIKDIHGNTALHIAAMKGNRRCVQLLVKSGAKTNVVNELNWMPHQEAISYGDFLMTKVITEDKLLASANALHKDKLLKLIKMSERDFVLKFQIRRKDFDPTITSSPTQGDVMLTLSKKGVRARFDIGLTDAFHSHTTEFTVIVDFNENVFRIILKSAPIYQIITLDIFEEAISHFIKAHLIDSLTTEMLSKENVSNNFEVDSSHSTQPLFRKVFSKKVAGLPTDIYETKGLDLIRKVRTEHLAPRNSTAQSNQEQSLQPPEPRNVTWDQYISSLKGQFPYLGREPIQTIHKNRVSIVIGLSKEIPLSFEWKRIVEYGLNLMGYKLSEEVAHQIKSLPEGFPTVIDLPFHRSTDYVKWKLISFEICSDLSDALFSVPDGYQQTEIIPMDDLTQSVVQ